MGDNPVISFQAEKLVNGQCYKFYWLNRTERSVLVYISTMEHGYTFHTKTQPDTVWDIEEFYNFVNNYQGTKWGDDGS